MPDWAAFAGITGAVLGLLLLLAHASQRTFDDRDARAATVGSDGSAVRRSSPRDGAPDDSPQTSRSRDCEGASPAGDAGGADGSVRGGVGADARSRDGVRPGTDTTVEALPTGGDAATPERGHESTAALLANVAVSQALFAGLLIGGALYAEVPPAAFGVTPGTTTVSALAVGVGLGVALYVANEVGAAVGQRFGLGGAEELRAALAPSTPRGWAALLLVVLPVIAGFEELLFRGALVGAFAAGFGVSPWLMAAVSSVAFALGHGAQGPAGIVVTGLLGFVLAAAYVLTGSLLAVAVAHYLVNALEFVVHEGMGIELGPSG